MGDTGCNDDSSAAARISGIALQLCSLRLQRQSARKHTTIATLLVPIARTIGKKTDNYGYIARSDCNDYRSRKPANKRYPPRSECNDDSSANRQQLQRCSFRSQRQSARKPATIATLLVLIARIIGKNTDNYGYIARSDCNDYRSRKPANKRYSARSECNDDSSANRQQLQRCSF